MSCWQTRASTSSAIGCRTTSSIAQAVDSAGELEAITDLARGMGDDDIAVIFPEGTRASPAKRERALTKLAERNPERSEKLAGLQHLLPPRPAGSAALLAGSPDADVVVAWHVGFDGLRHVRRDRARAGSAAHASEISIATISTRRGAHRRSVHRHGWMTCGCRPTKRYTS